MANTETLTKTKWVIDPAHSEIAFKVGKEDPSDFSKFFRTKTGCTPSEYRIRD